jgi:hypothetical protein
MAPRRLALERDDVIDMVRDAGELAELAGLPVNLRNGRGIRPGGRRALGYAAPAPHAPRNARVTRGALLGGLGLPGEAVAGLLERAALLRGLDGTGEELLAGAPFRSLGGLELRRLAVAEPRESFFPVLVVGRAARRSLPLAATGRAEAPVGARRRATLDEEGGAASVGLTGATLAGALRYDAAASK